jgi:hypothetical protein
MVYLLLLALRARTQVKILQDLTLCEKSLIDKRGGREVPELEALVAGKNEIQP